MEFKHKGHEEIREIRKEKPVPTNRFFVFSPAYRQAGLMAAASFFCFVLRQAQHDKTKKIKWITGIATNYTLS